MRRQTFKLLFIFVACLFVFVRMPACFVVVHIIREGIAGGVRGEQRGREVGMRGVLLFKRNNESVPL